jgi:hypothetical protein
MAKGLRSKCKRANRSLIRKTLTEPITRQRQAEMSAALLKELAEKRGDSIKSLASLMPNNAPKVVKDVEEDDMDEDEAEEDNEEDAGGKVAKTGSKQKGFTFLRRTSTKTKGSKPRNNPGKQLVWFPK